MRTVTGVILLLGAALLQTTLSTRINLLQGSADLVLLVLVAWMLQPGAKPDWKWGLVAGLFVGYLSALPIWLLIGAYTLAAFVCQLLSQRIWQVQLLTLFTSILLGTLSVHLVTMGYLFFNSQVLDFIGSLNLITIPTMLLNLIFILPIQAIMGELNKLISPIEEPA